MATEKMKQVAVRFPAKLKKQAESAAVRENRSFGGLIRHAVAWYIGQMGGKK